MLQIVAQTLPPLWDRAIAAAGDAARPSPRRHGRRRGASLSFSCHVHHHPTAGGHHH